MEYISFGDGQDVTEDGRYNNCTVFIEDPYYVAEQGKYAIPKCPDYGAHS